MPTHSRYRVSTDASGQLPDAGHALGAPLGYDVGCAEFAGELLPRLMAAHRDDPLGTHLPCRQHSEQADRAVTDHRDGHAGLHVGSLGGEPAGAHDIGERQQARDEIVRGYIRGGHQGAVREFYAQYRRLRHSNKFAMLAGSLVAGLAVWTGVVGEAEGTDDKLTGLDRGHGIADLLDDAAILVPHRGWLGERTDATVRPEVGTAHARGGYSDDGIGWFDDLRRVALLETHVARTV